MTVETLGEERLADRFKRHSISFNMSNGESSGRKGACVGCNLPTLSF